jgi:PhzF family phenazine biosynthesis protein
VSVLRYIRLDVFSNQPFTGIQLGVFPDAAGIDERRMQQIANEMALPETTFVFPPEAPQTDARVRIFTPTRELPMAGSPTIGTRVSPSAQRSVSRQCLEAPESSGRPHGPPGSYLHFALEPCRSSRGSSGRW